jgi:hypothetical protein
MKENNERTNKRTNIGLDNSDSEDDESHMERMNKVLFSNFSNRPKDKRINNNNESTNNNNESINNESDGFSSFPPPSSYHSFTPLPPTFSSSSDAFLPNNLINIIPHKETQNTPISSIFPFISNKNERNPKAVHDYYENLDYSDYRIIANENYNNPNGLNFEYNRHGYLPGYDKYGNIIVEPRNWDYIPGESMQERERRNKQIDRMRIEDAEAAALIKIREKWKKEYEEYKERKEKEEKVKKEKEETTKRYKEWYEKNKHIFEKKNELQYKNIGISLPNESLDDWFKRSEEIYKKGLEDVKSVAKR